MLRLLCSVCTMGRQRLARHGVAGKATEGRRAKAALSVHLRHGRKLECVGTLLPVIHFELREMVQHHLLVLVPALLLLEPIQYPTVVPLVGSAHSPECMCRMLVNLLTAPDLPQKEAWRGMACASVYISQSTV
jgi:hypothetical protein